MASDAIYSIETAKGDFHGTIEDVCAWQAEYQGPFASLILEDGTEVDVDDIEFRADDIEGTVAAVMGRIAEETES